MPKYENTKKVRAKNQVSIPAHPHSDFNYNKSMTKNVLCGQTK